MVTIVIIIIIFSCLLTIIIESSSSSSSSSSSPFLLAYHVFCCSMLQLFCQGTALCIAIRTPGGFRCSSALPLHEVRHQRSNLHILTQAEEPGGDWSFELLAYV